MLSDKTSNATSPPCARGCSPLSIVRVKAESFDAVWMHLEFVGSQSETVKFCVFFQNHANPSRLTLNIL